MRPDWFERRYWTCAHSWIGTFVLFLLPLKMDFLGSYCLDERFVFLSDSVMWHFFFWAHWNVFLQKDDTVLKIRSRNQHLTPPARGGLENKRTKKTRRGCTVLSEGVLVLGRGHWSGMIAELSEQTDHSRFSKCHSSKEQKVSLFFIYIF